LVTHMLKRIKRLIDKFRDLLKRIDVHCRVNRPILYALRADIVLCTLSFSALSSVFSVFFFVLGWPSLMAVLTFCQVMICLFMSVSWSSLVFFRRIQHSWLVVSLLNYKFLYISMMLLSMNIGLFLDIYMFLLNLRRTDALHTSSEQPVTLMIVCQSVILLIVVVAAVSIHGSIIESMNNDRVGKEIVVVFAFAFFLGCLLLICFAFSIDSRDFWRANLWEWLFGLLKFVLIFDFKHILYVFYFVEPWP
jgi:hypothetical protein